MSHTLSPTTVITSASLRRRSAAARNKSGSGLAYFTSSRVTTGTREKSKPSVASEGRAVSMRLLVAMANGMSASDNAASKARAPGSGRTVARLRL